MNSLWFDASIDPVQHDQLRQPAAGRVRMQSAASAGVSGWENFKRTKHVLPWEREPLRLFNEINKLGGANGFFEPNSFQSIT